MLRHWMQLYSLEGVQDIEGCYKHRCWLAGGSFDLSTAALCSGLLAVLLRLLVYTECSWLNRDLLSLGPPLHVCCRTH